MNRRDFVPRFTALLIAIGTANAQQSAPRHIGVLLVGLSPDGKEAQEFREGLRDAGYVEGRDVVIEWRSANGDYDRVPGLVSDLIQRRMQSNRSGEHVCGASTQARYNQHPDCHGNHR